MKTWIWFSLILFSLCGVSSGAAERRLHCQVHPGTAVDQTTGFMAGIKGFLRADCIDEDSGELSTFKSNLIGGGYSDSIRARFTFSCLGSKRIEGFFYGIHAELSLLTSGPTAGLFSSGNGLCVLYGTDLSYVGSASAAIAKIKITPVERVHEAELSTPPTNH